MLRESGFDKNSGNQLHSEAGMKHEHGFCWCGAPDNLVTVQENFGQPVRNLHSRLTLKGQQQGAAH